MSAPSVDTSTGNCGTACDASTTTVAPTACALVAISVIGLIVPSAFDTQVRATTLVFSVSSSSMLLRSSRPSSVTPNHLSVAPVRSHASCHGTMLLWCSISETTTTSPGFSAAPSVCAARLSASEAFLVKTISSRFGAPMNAATLSRPPSYAAVASAPS
jgi:hypothetical protein